MVRHFAIVALLLTGFTPASAQAGPLRTQYVVSLLGLPVGRASFETRFGTDEYTVSGTLASAGLANLVSRTQGTSSVSGRLRDGELFAEEYRLAYTSDGKSWSSRVQMRSGQVTDSQVTPRREEPLPEDFVAVTPEHLAAVVDPISALMVRAKASEVCERILPIYDGWTRLDLKLSSAGTRPFSEAGLSGDATVCEMRVVPVSGYRRGSKGLRYLQEQVLQIWFAPVGDTGIFAPIYVRIPTQIGPLTLTATVFAAP